MTTTTATPPQIVSIPHASQGCFSIENKEMIECIDRILGLFENSNTCDVVLNKCDLLEKSASFEKKSPQQLAIEFFEDQCAKCTRIGKTESFGRIQLYCRIEISLATLCYLQMELLNAIEHTLDIVITQQVDTIANYTIPALINRLFPENVPSDLPVDEPTTSVESETPIQSRRPHAKCKISILSACPVTYSAPATYSIPSHDIPVDTLRTIDFTDVEGLIDKWTLSRNIARLDCKELMNTTCGCCNNHLHIQAINAIRLISAQIPILRAEIESRRAEILTGTIVNPSTRQLRQMTQAQKQHLATQNANAAATITAYIASRAQHIHNLGNCPYACHFDTRSSATAPLCPHGAERCYSASNSLCPVISELNLTVRRLNANIKSATSYITLGHSIALKEHHLSSALQKGNTANAYVLKTELAVLRKERSLTEPRRKTCYVCKYGDNCGIGYTCNKLHPFDFSDNIMRCGFHWEIVPPTEQKCTQCSQYTADDFYIRQPTPALIALEKFERSRLSYHALIQKFAAIERARDEKANDSLPSTSVFERAKARALSVEFKYNKEHARLKDELNQETRRKAPTLEARVLSKRELLSVQMPRPAPNQSIFHSKPIRSLRRALHHIPPLSDDECDALALKWIHRINNGMINNELIFEFYSDIDGAFKRHPYLQLLVQEYCGRREINNILARSCTNFLASVGKHVIEHEDDDCEQLIESYDYTPATTSCHSKYGADLTADEIAVMHGRFCKYE